MNGNDVAEHIENNWERLEKEFFDAKTTLVDVRVYSPDIYRLMYRDELMEFAAQDLAEYQQAKAERNAEMRRDEYEERHYNKSEELRK